jgi:SEC-C motif domain protein
MSEHCPCGSGEDYAHCCGPFLSREKAAPTAEALMRSRYTAYARNEVAYLEKTLLPRKRANFNARETLAWNADVSWTGLRILATTDGGPEAAEGIVEFTASFVKQGETRDLHEVSSFKKKGGSWFYVDGRQGSAASSVVASKPKVGRNAPCPCGSGKKFKHCCG